LSERPSVAAQLFAFIKKSLKRCTGLNKGKTLFSLYGAFQRVLQAYSARLLARVPKTAAGQTSGVATNSTTDWQIKLDKAEEPVICLIVSTSEYCYETVGGLAESVANNINKEFAAEVRALLTFFLLTKRRLIYFDSAKAQLLRNLRTPLIALARISPRAVALTRHGMLI
jgi:hypothetical protein